MVHEDHRIVLDGVSKFYGEVLGVNRISLTIEPGVTSLVGPNGSGKTTLMNLLTGLLRPTQGSIRVLGIPANDPARLCRRLGYCTQFDAFPKGLTGHQFIYLLLRVHGHDHQQAEQRTWKALERVNLADAAHRKVAAYSKGMRQRIKLAQAISHDPVVLILDEPLNGLDPLARSEVTDLFHQFAKNGLHVVISSHILHEVEAISDRIIILSNGYVVAEGNLQDVRSEMEDHPMQILVRCDKPALVAARMFELDSAVEVRVHADGRGLVIATKNADKFYLLLNKVVLEGGLSVEGVAPADDDMHSVYRYLVNPNGSAQ